MAGGRGLWRSQWAVHVTISVLHSSMSSGPTEGGSVLLFCWFFVVVVFNKCLLSSLCYLTFTFGCWYQAEFPSPPTCSAHPGDLRRSLQLWSILHTSRDRGVRCPHSSQQPLGSAGTGVHGATPAEEPALFPKPSRVLVANHGAGRGGGGLLHSDPD